MIRKLLFWWHKNSFKLAGSYMGWYYLFKFKGIDYYRNSALTGLSLVGFSVAVVLFAYGVIFIIKEVGKLKWKYLILTIKSYIL